MFGNMGAELAYLFSLDLPTRPGILWLLPSGLLCSSWYLLPTGSVFQMSSWNELTSRNHHVMISKKEYWFKGHTANTQLTMSGHGMCIYLESWLMQNEACAESLQNALTSLLSSESELSANFCVAINATCMHRTTHCLQLACTMHTAMTNINGRMPACLH